MRKVEISISFDLDALKGYTDDYLARLHYVCQANPADIDDAAAIDAAEAVKAEILERWLRKAPISMFHHQGRHMRLVRRGGEV